jgi:superfamily II DNA/RNA helicase
MGFIPDIEDICTKLPPQRQTLLFSATMPAPIKKLADKFLTGPKTIEVARPATANASIDQKLLKVDARKKKDALVRLLDQDEVKTAIIFSNRKTTVRELTASLKRRGFRAGQIHGDMEQPDRIKELDRFKSEELNILVASDVAARGLDIKGVSHVFNFDVPWQPDDYIHRIGRTGRAGAKGVAVTLATSSDVDALAAIEKLLGSPIPEIEGGGRDAEPVAEKPERPARKAAEPKARKKAPKREEKAAPRAEAPSRAASADPVREPALVDEGWNGPVPSFLAQGFGS